MAIDGVYAADDDDQPQFQALLALDDREIARLTASLAERIPKLLQRRGLGPDSDPEESDPLSRDQPWLAGLYAASVSGKNAFGPNAGRRVTRIGDQIDPESLDALTSPRCASVSGFSLHADVSPSLPETVSGWNVWPDIAPGRLLPWNVSNLWLTGCNWDDNLAAPAVLCFRFPAAILWFQ